MKIAIPADQPDVKANVGNRLGTSQYLIVIDMKTMAVEAVPNPSISGQNSVGMQAVVLAIGKKVDAVLTGYCSPTAEKYLSANGIKVLTGISGIVEEVARQYKKGDLQKHIGMDRKSKSVKSKINKTTLLHALKNSSVQFVKLLPMLVGIVLLIGLFHACVSKVFISSLFSGNRVLDTLLGACFGSIFTGNPINSYIIGGELLEYGVSLFAVTALIISWVSVGLAQLPAEASFLGKKFAFVRNAISFALSIAIALATVTILTLIKGAFL